MGKWMEKVNIVLLVVFGLLYVGAKTHFFSRFGVLSLGDYLEAHWYFWAGMALAAGAGIVLNLATKRREPPKKE
jgi:choline-glycine betaine transporter